MLEVQPHVERRLWRDRNLQPKPFEALQHVVALVLEVPLERNLFLVRVHRIKERDSRELQGMVRTAVKERAGLRERGDEVRGADDPADAEAGQAPVLREPVHDDDRVLVHVVDVGSGGNGLAKVLLLFGIDVPRVELDVKSAPSTVNGGTSREQRCSPHQG